MLITRQRGVLDHASAARIVLRDWSTGEFVRYTMPQGTCASVSTERGDEDVLATMRSRKELRRAGDAKLVKLKAGAVEKRDVDLDVAWEEEEGGGGAEDEDGDEDEDEVDGDEAVEDVDGDDQSESGDGDADDDEDSEEDEAPELLTPPPAKRKRTVSFAAPTSDGKRRRGVDVSMPVRKGRR